MEEKENSNETVKPVVITPKEKVATMRAIKDVTSLDIKKPVITRLRKRLKELQELSQAVTTKIQEGHLPIFYTEPPQMFISGLEGSVSGNTGTITYSVYALGTDGNKILDTQYQTITTSMGDTKKIPITANYRMNKTVVETIEFRKLMTVKEYVSEVAQ